MRKNKKNWEIFSKSWKENAIVCDHFPTTPALITTTNNMENNMNIKQIDLQLKNDEVYQNLLIEIKDLIKKQAILERTMSSLDNLRLSIEKRTDFKIKNQKYFKVAQ